jgi:hypothetical protein
MNWVLLTALKLVGCGVGANMPMAGNPRADDHLLQLVPE